jgi:uncharacterized protein YkwD
VLRRALTVWVIGLAATAHAAPAHAATPTEPVVARASAQSELIDLINIYRSARGLQALSADAALTNAAAWMANDMATRNYIGHVSSDGRSPTQRMLAFGYPATTMYTGEDLGAGHATASAVLAAWKASAAHNAVLLNPKYSAIGVGLAQSASSTYKWYWAADFGGPGGTVTVLVPPPAPPRAAAAPRATNGARMLAESIDPAQARLTGRAQFLAELGERRIVHLIAVLTKKGVL